MNVLFFVSGYPTPDNLSHGVFNQRAATAISKYVDLTVIQYRIYLPGRKFILRIQENGFKRIVLCIPYIPFFEKWFYYFNARLFYVAALFFLKNELKGAQLLHSGDGNIGVLGGWLKKRYRFKTLVQFIGADLNQDLKRIRKKRWMQSWASNVDAFSFNSQSLKNAFESMFGSQLMEKIIYRGVDTVVFKRVTPLGLPEVRFYFLGGLPGYHSHEHGRNTKGGFLVMEAWRKLELETSNQVTLVFAGPDSDIDIARRWRNSLKYPDRVVLYGKVAPSDIVKFHNNGNVCLVPSLEEGLPNVALEAMATSNLVIASKAGGIPEVIIHQQNGLLLDSPDKELLFECMLQVSNQSETIESLGKHARSFIEQHFNSSKFGERYYNYYKNITGVI